jgi:hypothetical protein
MHSKKVIYNETIDTLHFMKVIKTGQPIVLSNKGFRYFSDNRFLSFKEKGWNINITIDKDKSYAEKD